MVRRFVLSPVLVWLALHALRLLKLVVFVFWNSSLIWSSSPSAVRCDCACGEMYGENEVMKQPNLKHNESIQKRFVARDWAMRFFYSSILTCAMLSSYDCNTTLLPTCQKAGSVFSITIDLLPSKSTTSPSVPRA